jgi:hypothetical protein
MHTHAVAEIIRPRFCLPLQFIPAEPTVTVGCAASPAQRLTAQRRALKWLAACGSRPHLPGVRLATPPLDRPSQSLATIRNKETLCQQIHRYTTTLRPNEKKNKNEKKLYMSLYNEFATRIRKRPKKKRKSSACKQHKTLYDINEEILKSVMLR